MYNEKILIVEDEPAIREMVVMTLEMAGFDSLQAADVSEAHQQVVDHRPSLILLDWMTFGIRFMISSLIISVLFGPASTWQCEQA